MSDCMIFPEDWHDFLKDYSFDDSEEVYTNGSRLIQVYRVEQLIEHLLEALTPHVMTLDEVKTNRLEPLWLETQDDSYYEWALWRTYDDEDMMCFWWGDEGESWQVKVPPEEYCVEWRCWSAPPTEEQRKAAAWHEA